MLNNKFKINSKKCGSHRGDLLRNNLPSMGHEFVLGGPNGAQPVVLPAHVTTPQPDGSRAPIKTHDLRDAVNMLGFYHALDPKTHPHVSAMVK